MRTYVESSKKRIYSKLVGETGTHTVLFHKQCSYGKTLKRTDRSESARENTRNEEIETKTLPNKNVS